jgi:transposase-like protein
MNSEVVLIAKRCGITNADKRRMVVAAAACTKPGEIGALWRRECVYSSALATWRRQYAAGELNGAESKRRAPKVGSAREELKLRAQVYA